MSSQNVEENYTKSKTKSHKPIILLRRSSCGQILSKYGSASKKERDRKFMQPVRNVQTPDLLNMGMDRPKSASATVGPRSLTPLTSSFVSPAVSLANIKQESLTDNEGEAWIKPNTSRSQILKKPKKPPQNDSRYQQVFIANSLIGDQMQNMNVINVNNMGNVITLPNTANDKSNFLQILPNQQFVVQPMAENSQNQYIFSNEIKMTNHQSMNMNNKVLISNTGTNNSPFILTQCPQMVSSINQRIEHTSENSTPHIFYNGNNFQTKFQGQQLKIVAQQQPNNCQLSNNGLKQTKIRPAPSTQDQRSLHKEIQPDDDSLTNITWLGRMGINNIMPVPIEDKNSLTNGQKSDRGGRPPYSYMALIQFAINSTPQRRMTLRQVYQWIEEKFPYFRSAKPGWKNSIRHNLSLHDIFVREVASGSKSSYWTLRSDLNRRPLTLDSMKGSSQHVFDSNVYTNQVVGPGQKPLLPRPPASQPFMFVPVVPEGENGDKTVNEDLNAETPKGHASIQLQDSGFYSDQSHFHDSTRLSVESSQFIPSAEKNNPMFSQSCLNSNSGKNRKRSRKEPLKLLNDSLDSSLQFFKFDSNSSSKTSSPLIPYKHRSTVDPNSIQVTPKSIGLSEENFSDIMNDLGSPFQNFFKPNHQGEFIAPDDCQSNRGFISTLNNITPLTRKKRPRKQSVRVLSSPKGRLQPCELYSEDIENIDPNCLTPRSKKSLKDTFGSPGIKSTPFLLRRTNSSPGSLNNTPVKSNSHLPNSDFMNEFITSVFKTPERNMQMNVKVESPPSHDNQQNCNNILPSIFGSNCDATGTLNTSFSKLLDLSGVGFLGGSMCSNSNYNELADVSWSNLGSLE